MEKKQIIKLYENQLKTIVKESVERILNEANSYGWEVETGEAELAYRFMEQELGTDELNSAIVRAMGEEPLSQILAYLLRMYDMRGWEQYKEEHSGDL
jgi:hypothetical protein